MPAAMRRLSAAALLSAALSLLAAPAALAQQAQAIESDQAVLIWNDHDNSQGERLTQPWQVIRQDRANLHRHGQADPQDDWDGLFGSQGNRELAERMIARGRMDPGAARAIVDGPVMIRVTIPRDGLGCVLAIDVF